MPNVSKITEFVETVVEEDVYESLPENTPFSTYMMAGAAAGIAEHCCMYPVDSVKTRMQSINPSPAARYRNLLHALKEIISKEGLWRPVRGINAVAAGAGPAHALYFSCYEQLKKYFLGARHTGHHPLAFGVAGCFATLIHDAIMNPAEVVKQRMQMYDSPYKDCTHCFRQIWKEEGTRAFYRSYMTQLSMNIPFQCTHFMVYEWMQEVTNPCKEYNALTHSLSGAVAGGVAAAATTPLDVCKTLLNTQERCAVNRLHAIDSIFEAAGAIYRYQGIGGFFRGLQARVVFQMPATAISWSVYEFFKHVIKNSKQSHVEASSMAHTGTVLAAQQNSSRNTVRNCSCKRNDCLHNSYS